MPDQETNHDDRLRLFERNLAWQYLDLTHAIIVAINRDQQVSMINRAGCDVLGHRRAEILGRCWFDVFVPERIRAELKQAFETLLRGGLEETEHFENPILTRDGDERLIAWHNTLLRDEAGNVVGTLSSGDDVTERRKIELALRESKERFERVTQQSREMVWEVNTDGLFTYVSSVCQEILGYRPDEMIGRMHFYDLQAPEDRERFWRESKIQMARRESFRNEINKAWTKDGRMIWFLTSGSPVVDDCDNLKGYQGSDLEITERIAMEEKLRLEHEELVRKNIALKQILDHLDEEKSQYKHEINAAIENLSSRFVEKLRRRSVQLTRRDIDAFENAINSLIGKGINKFRNGQSKLTPRERDICDLVRKGMTSKQIAARLNIDVQTVHKHRDSIREKLQLKHKGLNLTSYLRSK